MSNNFRRHRGRVAALTRYRDPADPQLLDAQRLMHEEAFLEVIRKAVADVPTFTIELRQRAIKLLSVNCKWTQ